MSAFTFGEIKKSNFEHIKYGEPCPFTSRVLTQMLRDSRWNIDQASISPRLVQCLDDCLGTEEIVKNRRKVTAITDYINSRNDDLWNWFGGGSVGDGFRIKYSDVDAMYSMQTVVVTYPDKMHLVPRNSENKTILLIREAGCRPGYVNLEILQIGDREVSIVQFRNAVVPVGDLNFVSSDIYRQETVEALSRATGEDYVSNGPCTTLFPQSNESSRDVSSLFPCVCWPRVANEWKHRTRLHGWPSQTMIDRIVQGGCHLVPVGDKCSTDTLLQWRISFACAEQLLVHSFTHPQFRVYGLLKCFLYQIKDLLDHIIGDSDILCSYFIKTVIFYAVENSPHLLWDGKNTFICFRFCLSILIAWVKSSYCPNYFIRRNNLFLRKVHGENREKLLHFLIDFYYLNWMCLSIESVSPCIGIMLQEHQSLKSIQHLEYLRDLDLFRECFFSLSRDHGEGTKVYSLMKNLLEAKTDVDEFIAFCAMTNILYKIACTLFNVYTTTKSNKQKYLALRKCKQLLARQASVCTSPGMMLLATCDYLTGDYKNTIRICAEMTSTFKLYVGDPITETKNSREQYQRLYCGQGYPLHQKLKKGVYSCLMFYKRYSTLCLPHLLPEVTKHHIGVAIPPLPYVSFLSFLCYHDLGDWRRRDTELTNLRAVNVDPEQGGHDYWIVHTMLGICYQTVGDYCQAIRSFTDSVHVMPHNNAAIERLHVLRFAYLIFFLKSQNIISV